jgi:hypothetical protein
VTDVRTRRARAAIGMPLPRKENLRVPESLTESHAILHPASILIADLRPVIVPNITTVMDSITMWETTRTCREDQEVEICAAMAEVSKGKNR